MSADPFNFLELVDTRTASSPHQAGKGPTPRLPHPCILSNLHIKLRAYAFAKPTANLSCNSTRPTKTKVVDQIHKPVRLERNNDHVESSELSIVLPAKNEAAGLDAILPILRAMYPQAEILVVDSGSTDKTVDIARNHGALVLSQPYSYGNGAAVKAGLREATRDHIVLMDADGQHDPRDLPRLIAEYEKGYDMVVGAREPDTQATTGRRIANFVYSKFASRMVNRKIDDLTSGFRIVRAQYAREFLHLLPNGFSYPATITMAFFRSGFSVAYVPVRARSRHGTSHINPLSDGIRFLLIIFKIGTLYSPLKVFTPLSMVFLLLGIANYIYTYWTTSRLTNMTVLLISSAALVFMIGLLSEQITNLYYGIRNHSNPHDHTRANEPQNND